LLEINTGDVITNKETLLVETSLDNDFMMQDLSSYQKVRVGSNWFSPVNFSSVPHTEQKINPDLIPGVILTDRPGNINDSICLILYFSYSKKHTFS
jgi:hypothetical protein